MITLTEDQPTPIEVWLTKNNIEIVCRVTREDETIRGLAVTSLSMRGAMREMSGYFIDEGYKPAGRWVTEAEADGEVVEASRKFRIA